MAGQNKNHRRALWVIITAAILDIIFGIIFAAAAHVSIGMGLYYATATATTAGNAPVTLSGWLPYTLTVLIMLTVIPLFSACFSLFTAGLTTNHVDQRHEEMKAHVTRTSKRGGDNELHHR